jgi:hypothetical protein
MFDRHLRVFRQNQAWLHLLYRRTREFVKAVDQGLLSIGGSLPSKGNAGL